MRDEHTRGRVRQTGSAVNLARGRPPEPRGTPSSGRIVTLLVGQGHGFIRLPNGRDVFFHRSDVRDGSSFNDFAVGDTMTFELLEDHVSGPRAAHVERRPRR